ncbi:MAG: hypothetical protein J7K34_01585 [Flavobacteriaceae bacterium]|nr:hypothetical protein [Flavobacteriaceae bacterium]
MVNIHYILFFGIFLVFLSCKQDRKELKNINAEWTFEERLKSVSDSIKVEDIVIKNLFKSQILAHQGGDFDSLMIIEKVYKPHLKLWNNCYAMIFGEENASKFNTEKGMINWNKTLYPENKTFFDARAKKLLELNLDATIQYNLDQFHKLVPYKVKSTISILFTPITGILFGGCANDQFSIELNYKEQDIEYTIEKGFPHELNHLAYEPFRENDPKKDTALRQIIDEGFACYFTWIFFEKKISKFEAVENMTEKEWNWYLKNENEIFNKLSPFFEDESGDNPLLRNDKYQLFPNAPKTLYYWLGFRIVQNYVNLHGKNSWRDIYKMNVQEVLEKSDYENYIN